MNKIPFSTADILIPRHNLEKWPVIACDQFTSAKEYWELTEKNVGENISTLKITLPEIYLEEDGFENRIEKINENMLKYINDGIFQEYKDSLIYVERIQPDGRVRAGIVGAVDLEAYDYRKGSQTMIRATEGTVLERIPPRVQIRKDAPLETPHIILLIDDVKKTVIEPLASKKNEMTKIYDIELMMGGGHISGYLIKKNNVEAIYKALNDLCNDEENPLLFAVGDGNHSLATAKECYELAKKASENTELKRFALAEIENIHSEALDFEPIYRILFSVNPIEIVELLKERFNTTTPNQEIIYYHQGKEGRLPLFVPSDKLVNGVLQDFIDEYITQNPSARVDYIHGIEDIKKLSNEENSIGFIYDGISKHTLFSTVKATGALPRKTFSMGHAKDKRYYLECRKIK